MEFDLGRFLLFIGIVGSFGGSLGFLFSESKLSKFISATILIIGVLSLAIAAGLRAW